MPTYRAPLGDIRFVLDEVLGVEQLSALPGYEEATPDVIHAVLEEGARLCEDVLFPINQSGDAEGCAFERGEVRTPKGFADAYRTFREGGWSGLDLDPEYGGQGLPRTVRFVMDELLSSANLSFAMYPGLTHGAFSGI